jgi:hypothetical protein
LLKFFERDEVTGLKLINENIDSLHPSTNIRAVKTRVTKQMGHVNVLEGNSNCRQNIDCEISW